MKELQLNFCCGKHTSISRLSVTYKVLNSSGGYYNGNGSIGVVAGCNGCSVMVVVTRTVIFLILRTTLGKRTDTHVFISESYLVRFKMIFSIFV